MAIYVDPDRPRFEDARKHLLGFAATAQHGTDARHEFA